VSKVSVKLSL